MEVLRAAKLQQACVPAVPCAQEKDKVAALVESSGGEDLELLVDEDTGEPVVATGMEPVVKDIDRASNESWSSLRGSDMVDGIPAGLTAHPCSVTDLDAAEAHDRVYVRLSKRDPRVTRMQAKASKDSWSSLRSSDKIIGIPAVLPAHPRIVRSTAGRS
jgi:hypothetical protein